MTEKINKAYALFALFILCQAMVSFNPGLPGRGEKMALLLASALTWKNWPNLITSGSQLYNYKGPRPGLVSYVQGAFVS